MDDKGIIFTIDRIRAHERNKAIEECLKIIKFYTIYIKI